VSTNRHYPYAISLNLEGPSQADCADYENCQQWHGDCISLPREPAHREEVMDCIAQCDYCRSSIVSGQRWVREKIYDPAHNGCDPRYRRYHAEPFAGQQASCWEKREMEREIARTVYAA